MAICIGASSLHGSAPVNKNHAGRIARTKIKINVPVNISYAIMANCARAGHVHALAVPEELGRHVVQGADGVFFVSKNVVLNRRAMPKSASFARLLGVDEDVLRFEVAVDDLRVARVVEIVHGVGDVDRHR